MKCKWNNIELQKLYNGKGYYYSCPNENSRKKARCGTCTSIKNWISYAEDKSYNTRRSKKHNNNEDSGCLGTFLILIIIFIFISLIF